MKTWSSIVCQGVSEEYSNQLKDNDEQISIIREVDELFYTGSEIVINERITSDEIQSKENHSRKVKGEGKFYRRRPIPKKKKKTYETKPKKNEKFSEKKKFILWDED